MCVYLLHFNEPYQHAKHYLGYTESEDTLPSRLRYHEQGKGARLMWAVCKAGIGYQIAKLWEDGDRELERKLKEQKNTPRLCPICQELKEGGEKCMGTVGTR